MIQFMAHNLQLDRINTHVFSNRIPILNSTRNFSQDHHSHRNHPAKFRMTQRIVRPNNNKKIKSQAVSPESSRPTYNGNNIKPSLEMNGMRKSYTYQKDPPTQKLSNILNMQDLKTNTDTPGRAAALGNHSPQKLKIRTNGLVIDTVSTSVQKLSKQKKYVIRSNRKYSHQVEQKQRYDIKITQGKPQFTVFEQQQIKKYEVYYKGARRIFQKQDFTDGQGNSLIQNNDAIAYRYQIIQQLGRGAFGKVYKAIDHKKNEQVALKVIRSIPKLNKQSKIQIQMLQNVIKNDPQGKSNIVRIKGSFVFRGHTCISYEMLSLNLYQYIKLNKFRQTPNHILTKFAIQILHSLNYLQGQKIVHCDIKPENIMLKEPHKTGVRLIDLGSSCYEEQQYYTYIQSRFYRAPQIILGMKYSTAIDMWSFGCVLAELHTGYPLFPGDNQEQQLMMYIQLLGHPPVFMLEEGVRRKRFFNQNFQCRIIQPAEKFRIPKGLSFQRALQHCPDKHFVQFIKRCICWQPNKRITPKQALLHDWILQSIPANIKARHIVEVTGEGIHF